MFALFVTWLPGSVSVFYLCGRNICSCVFAVMMTLHDSLPEGAFDEIH